MNLWTTRKLKDLFFSNLNEVNLLNQDTYEIDFFKKAGFFDVVVLEYNDGYKSFISNYKFKGYDGLVIICDFRKGIFTAIETHNTIILDVAKLGMETCKEVINFLINRHTIKMKPFYLYANKGVNKYEGQNFEKINAKEVIINKLKLCCKERFNVILSIPVFEDGRKVTARGTSYIKDINENFFIIEKIKPIYFSYKIKPEEPLKIIFSDKINFYEAKCPIRSKKDDIIFLDIPEVVEVERRKYVRVEPSYKNPVKIIIHITGEDNEVVDCLDISISGTSVISQRDLQEKGVYVFGIKIPNDDRIIICEGFIVYKVVLDSKYKYGIDFDLTEKEADIIANYIRKREIEILDLLKENI